MWEVDGLLGHWLGDVVVQCHGVTLILPMTFP